MTRLRVELDVKHRDKDDVAYVVRVACVEDGWQAPERPMRRGKTHGYPLPPLEEAATWAGEPHAALCAADNDNDEPHQALRLRLLLRPDNDELTQFGRYVFAAMFGSLWKDITTRYKEEDGFDIEILCSQASGLDFVPWEMMANGARPLIAEGAHSISRVVVPEKKQAAGDDANDSAKKDAKVYIDLPMRVLFVVGELDDNLRPGAEFLGILRNLDGAVNGGPSLSTVVHVRSLVDAEATQIEEAANTFLPNIVHIVAHGMVEDGNPAIRLTRRDDKGQRSVDPCTAGRLLELLRGHDTKTPLPAVVIVNACHTADQIEPGDPRSYAASLVRGGVMAAVGMAGEVASNACRLFTKAAYAALAQKRGVHAAIANGQRAARLHYEKYDRSVEWARPALFVAENAEMEFRENAERVALIAAAAQIRGSANMMCDRYGPIRAYEQFVESNPAVNPGAPRVLAFVDSTTPGKAEPPYEWKVGKTHLLEELSWRAMLDGYLTCLVPSTDSQPPPGNLLLFAIKLAEMLDEVRGRFDIELLQTSAAQRRAFLAYGFEGVELRTADGKDNSEQFDHRLDEVKTDLRDKVGTGHPKVTVESIGNAIRKDIENLVRDVRTKCRNVRSVLILIDDLHKYGGYLELLDLVKDHGLGSKEAPAPLVVTYASYAEKGPDIEKKLPKKEHKVGDFTQVVRLDPFPATAESRLAYSQYILTQRYAPTHDRAKQERLDQTFQKIHASVAGVPSLMGKIREMLYWGNDDKLFIEANDEEIFKALQGD